ncbi:hypothetical protein B0T19DRAFT_161775 [Cercophora scortea]|uniref:C2H2-type domain-containing protein n=1 Tax=Cercophora scortea TaxID=314031 RepID=A0AAE0MCE2_9PEZI|nr:hypothetical protein B0T19DRAFT_161775 [Cercophora scortea]
MASISENVLLCLRAFQALTAAPLDVPSAGEERLSFPEIDDEFSRFKVWSANIGAHQTGRSSLDYRLRDASNIKNQVVKLLQNLAELLHDAIDIITEHTSPLDEESTSPAVEEEPDSEDEDEPALESELSQISFSIVEVINCLFRLSVSIRNPTPHDRFKKSAFTDTSTYEPYDIGHVRMKFPSAEGVVTHRVGKSISRRRQYFKYRELHHQKLSQGLDHDEPAVPEDVGKSTIASSIPQHLKTSVTGNIMNPTTVNEDELSDDGRSQATSYATASTTLDSGTTRPMVPPMPKQATGGPFECPFCFQMISVTTKAAWRKHVFADLRPYVCLSMDCPLPDQDFRRRHHWVSHVKQLHWKTWVCRQAGCKAASRQFDTAMDMRRHILEEHPEASNPKQLESILSLSEQPKPLVSSAECPLCHAILGSFKQYQRHVGRHQEDLALFALPSLEADDSDQDADEKEDEEEDGEADEEEEDANESGLEELTEADDVKGEWPDFFKGDPESDAELPPNRRARETPAPSWRSFLEQNDLRNQQAEPPTMQRGAPMDSLPHRSPPRASDTQDERRAENVPAEDVLRIIFGDMTYQEHFPAYSIGDGKLCVRDLQDRTALIHDLPSMEALNISASYKGRRLNDRNKPLRDYGVKNNSEITMVHEVPNISRAYSPTVNDDDPFGVGAPHTRERRYDSDSPAGDTLYIRERRYERDSSADDDLYSSGRYRHKRSYVEPLPDDAPYPGERKDSRKGKYSEEPLHGRGDRSEDPTTTMEKILALNVKFDTKLYPLCSLFMTNPPDSPDERKAEHQRLSEAVMTQVVFPLDAIDTDGFPDLLDMRMTLVKRVQEMLMAMDKKIV